MSKYFRLREKDTYLFQDVEDYLHIADPGSKRMMFSAVPADQALAGQKESGASQRFHSPEKPVNEGLKNITKQIPFEADRPVFEKKKVYGWVGSILHRSSSKAPRQKNPPEWLEKSGQKMDNIDMKSISEAPKQNSWRLSNPLPRTQSLRYNRISSERGNDFVQPRHSSYTGTDFVQPRHSSYTGTEVFQANWSPEEAKSNTETGLECIVCGKASALSFDLLICENCIPKSGMKFEPHVDEHHPLKKKSGVMGKIRRMLHIEKKSKDHSSKSSVAGVFSQITEESHIVP